MKTTKTPKGTSLPLMNLKGKDYLQVAHRLIWFREEEPQSSIETTALSLNEEYAVFQAKISRDGRVIATATKRESKKDFPDFIEKAETGAIGRALALMGYGTQFTLPDLDEGERLADAPVTLSNATVAPASSAAPLAKSTAEFKPSTSAGFTKPKSKTSEVKAPAPQADAKSNGVAKPAQQWD